MAKKKTVKLQEDIEKKGYAAEMEDEDISSDDLDFWNAVRKYIKSVQPTKKVVMAKQAKKGKKSDGGAIILGDGNDFYNNTEELDDWIKKSPHTQEEIEIHRKLAESNRKLSKRS